MAKEVLHLIHILRDMVKKFIPPLGDVFIVNVVSITLAPVY